MAEVDNLQKVLDYECSNPEKHKDWDFLEVATTVHFLIHAMTDMCTMLENAKRRIAVLEDLLASRN